MREGWCLWTSMLLLLRAQVAGLHTPLEGQPALGLWREKGTGKGGLGSSARAPRRPLRGPENPSPEVPSRGGQSRPQQHGLPGSLCGGRVSRPRVAGALG